MNVELTKVRDWAQGKLDAELSDEHESSWATHRYLHLVALIDGILGCRQRQSASASGARVVHIDTARRRRAMAPQRYPLS